MKDSQPEERDKFHVMHFYKDSLPRFSAEARPAAINSSRQEESYASSNEITAEIALDLSWQRRAR